MYLNVIAISLLFLCATFFGEEAQAALTDADLAARQARIGAIVIQVDDVFETSPLAAPYRLVNSLHIDTRPPTIASQLLFKVGDAFDRHVLDESERLLRDQRYLNAAAIEVTAYHETENTVDLLVRVHDVWTLSPGISFGRKGGVNATRIELEENNFLGLGKRIEFWRSQDVDRTALRVRYLDPNILGSWWRLSSAYVTSSDGGEQTLDLARPFYSLDTRWSAGLLASDATMGVPRYRLGELVEQFNLRRRKLDVQGGWSQGLRNGWVRRYLAGLRSEERTFSPFRNQPAAIPLDRTVSYPWIGVEWLEDSYHETRNLNQIGRIEDIHLGLAARVEAGYALPALGSTQSAIVWNGAISLGRALSERQYVLNEATFQGRWEDDALVNGRFDVTSRYYLRMNSFSVFYASLSGTMTSKLDPEEQLTLGGDNGLRGYPLRYQSGKRHALLTLEQRFYTGWQPFKLFDVGGAVFFDVGRSWGDAPYSETSSGTLKDLGFGLRLGNARSALGNVLHLDLAFPLNGPRNIAAMQVIIDTKRSF